MKEKVVNFEVGGMEEVEEEILDSSRLDLSKGKENKEVLHVLAIVDLGCVDLTKDQFPNMVDKMPSSIIISSHVKVISKNATNPLIVHDTTKTSTDGHPSELHKASNEAWERIHVLEERMHLLTKLW